MATKLGRKIMPSGHTREDFKCFGPAAVKDDEFEGTMIADLGCFMQEDVDSNKNYSAAVVQSRINSQWYAYFEWGRTGASPDFLFVECCDRNEAEREYVKQVKSKNIKRGEWTKVGGLSVLRPKVDKHGKSKDLYLVRPAARRTTGLPDGQRVITDDADKSKKTVKTSSSSATKKTTKKTAASRWDPKTLELGKALTGAVLDYTRKSFVGDYVPTQNAIDEGRDVLTEALKRVKVVGDNTKDQVADADLKQLTYLLYSRVPKEKPVRAAESTWILSGANIKEWQDDLDAFESALWSLAPTSDDGAVTVSDPFGGFDLEMKWMDPKTVEGKFIHKWMPEASANRHYGVGDMRIQNMWALRQTKLVPAFSRKVDVIAKQNGTGRRDKPKFQPSTRPDLNTADQKRFKDANVAMLLHGSRTVNISGILRTGLRLPRELVGVAITGAYLGPGCYWADDWRKSDGYTSRQGTYWAGGAGAIKGRGAFMFVGDVVLGIPYVSRSSYSGIKPPHGFHSVAGLVGRNSVQNNEWVVYNTDQQKLCYLVEYSTK